MLPVSPPLSFPHAMYHEGDVSSPQGFWCDGLNAHLRDDSLDLALLVSAAAAQFAGVFTTNAVRAAPVELTRAVHLGGISRAAIINSKNANALTGAGGAEDAAAMQAETAQRLGILPAEVAVASTGVIGVSLPMEQVSAGIAQLTARFGEGRTPDGLAAAQAILTTDTAVKCGAMTVECESGSVEIGMMVKGSGMIHPQMATMLAFFTTDAAIDKPMLDQILRRVVDRSFHRVTVDGDQSTNDMALIWANGCSGVAINKPQDLVWFEHGLTELARHGARMMAADGEGATHLIMVKVAGAATEADAALKARAIASSSLVKTAVYGRDPNWGRVLAAAGSVGLPWQPEKASLTMNGLALFVEGEPVIGQETAWSASMNRSEIEFVLDLAAGSESGEAFGCDLTDGYVEINAHYRT